MERETKRIKIQSVLALVLEAAGNNYLHRNGIKIHFACRFIDEAETIHELMLAREKALQCDQENSSTQRNMTAIAFTLSDIIEYIERRYSAELNNNRGLLTPEIKQETISHFKGVKSQERQTNIRPNPILELEPQSGHNTEVFETQRIQAQTVRALNSHASGVRQIFPRNRSQSTQKTQMGIGLPASVPQEDHLDHELDSAQQEVDTLLKALNVRNQLQQIIQNIENMGIPVVTTGSSLFQDIEAVKKALRGQNSFFKKLARLFQAQKDLELHVSAQEIEVLQETIQNDPAICSINVHELYTHLAQTFVTIRSKIYAIKSRERFEKARTFFAKFQEANNALNALGA